MTLGPGPSVARAASGQGQGNDNRWREPWLQGLELPAASRHSPPKLGISAQALGFDDSALAVAAVEKALSQRQ